MYYVIMYKWRENNYDWSQAGYCHECIDIHPLEWLKVHLYEDKIYVLLNWKEISKEEYEKYKDEIE